MNWTTLAYVALGFATQIPWAIYAIRGDREVARLTHELVLISDAINDHVAEIRDISHDTYIAVERES